MIPEGLLPSREQEAFIAGGWAACPSLASDMDVWVRVDPFERSIDKVREHLVDYLKNLFLYEFEEQADERKSLTGVDEQGYDIEVEMRKVGKVTYFAQPIHIMLTYASVDKLLQCFDVSTHQIAITDQGIVKGEKWTPITVPPVKLKHTPTTDARMEKIAIRYGHAKERELAEAF